MGGAKDGQGQAPVPALARTPGGGRHTMLHAVVMLVVLIVGGFRVPSTDATQTPPEVLLARSIDFHDPQSHWAGSTIQLHWSGTDPGTIIDPEVTELIGCRFCQDEDANDGEYITFEGLAEDEGLRLPQTRRWCANSEDRFLGEDVIGGLVVGR